MAALTPVSFTSSVVTTLDSWRAFVEHDPEPVALLTEVALNRLAPAERLTYDDQRSDYHAALPALKTPMLDRTVNKGLIFMRLNRGQQLGTSCGMVLSGVPGVGKSTAIRALGRTVERTYRTRNPQMTTAAVSRQSATSIPCLMQSVSRQAGAACSAIPSGVRRSCHGRVRARSRSSTSPTPTSAPLRSTGDLADADGQRVLLVSGGGLRSPAES